MHAAFLTARKTLVLRLTSSRARYDRHGARWRRDGARHAEREALVRLLRGQTLGYSPRPWSQPRAPRGGDRARVQAQAGHRGLLRGQGARVAAQRQGRRVQRCRAGAHAQKVQNVRQRVPRADELVQLVLPTFRRSRVVGAGDDAEARRRRPLGDRLRLRLDSGRRDRGRPCHRTHRTRGRRRLRDGAKAPRAPSGRRRRLGRTGADQSRRIPPRPDATRVARLVQPEPVASAKPSTHERGLDPALERSYAALGTAFGATEAEVRIAYQSAFAAFTRTRADRRSNSRGSTTRSRRSIATRGRTARVPRRCARSCRRPRSRFLRRRGRRSRGSSCRWPCTETPRGCTL